MTRQEPPTSSSVRTGRVATIAYTIIICALVWHESWNALWTHPNSRWQLVMEGAFGLVLLVGALFAGIRAQSPYRLPSVLGALAIALVSSTFLIFTITPHSGTGSVFTSMVTASVVSGVALAVEAATALAQRGARLWVRVGAVCGGLLSGVAAGVFFVGLAPFWM